MADDPTDAEPELASDETVSEPDSAAGAEAEETGADDAAPAKDAPKKAAPAKATPVVRKKVVSKRVTPKGGVRPGATPSSSGPTTKAKAKRAKVDDDEDVSFSSGRYTPPSSKDLLPSPWWVPALMFGFLIVGALVIMLNYMGVFGDAENWRLIIGLGLILAGIVTATQYR